MVNLYCHLERLWTQLKDKLLDTAVTGYLEEAKLKWEDLPTLGGPILCAGILNCIKSK